MRTLSKYQIKTLKLHREGKTLNEICKATKYSTKRAQDALRRAEQNVNDAIKILQVVSENGGLTAEEADKLSKILGKR
jgi:transcriptional regulator